MKQIRKIPFHFAGAMAPPAVASRQGMWCSKNTGSGTVKSVDGGSLDLAMDATSEVQNSCLYFGDVLSFPIDKLVAMEFEAKISASLAAAVSAVMGLGSARNDDPDAVATNCWFKLAGSNTVVCESDDGTTDLDDKSTGIALSTTYKRFRIDFSEGIQTRQAPSLSLGGKSNVIFSVENARGALDRVVKNTMFDLTQSTANLQPIFQIQKTTGTAVGTLSLLDGHVELRMP